MNAPPTITPGHIQRAKDVLLAAGTLEAAGSQALDLATVFYIGLTQAVAMKQE